MSSFADLGIEVSASSGETTTTCPKCSSDRKKKRDKCLSVNVDKGVYFCHHCSWKGRLTPTKTVYRRPAAPPPLTRPDPINQFFDKRGISAETLDSCGVGVAQAFVHGQEQRCIAFPYWDRDMQLVDIKYRSGQKGFAGEKGCEKVFYNIWRAEKEQVIITEGEVDTLSFWEAGFRSVISVPSGASGRQMDYLARETEFFDSVREVVIASDSDAPGEALKEELARRIGKERCRYVEYPEGCKDANEVLVHHGVEAVKALVSEAPRFPVEGIYHLDSFVDDLDDLYANGSPKGDTVGYPRFDELYSVAPGELTIVTGIPGHGKSTFIDQLMVRLADREGWTFGIYSPENFPLQLHAQKFIEQYSGEGFGFLPNGARCMPQEVFEEGKWFVSKHMHFIMPSDEEPHSIDNILKKAKALVFLQGIKGLVIDPYNEIEHSKGEGESEGEYVSTFLAKIKRFARANRVHVWLVAHPTKMPRETDGQLRVPSLMDVSGSANFRNKADMGLVVYRDFNRLTTRVITDKVRFKNEGKLGSVEFTFNVKNGRYEEL